MSEKVKGLYIKNHGFGIGTGIQCFFELMVDIKFSVHNTFLE